MTWNGVDKIKNDYKMEIITFEKTGGVKWRFVLKIWNNWSRGRKRKSRMDKCFWKVDWLEIGWIDWGEWK